VETEFVHGARITFGSRLSAFTAIFHLNQKYSFFTVWVFAYVADAFAAGKTMTTAGPGWRSSSAMDAPCRSAMARTKLSPRPLPGVERLVSSRVEPLEHLFALLGWNARPIITDLR
jgi:hypothetical protein